MELDEWHAPRVLAWLRVVGIGAFGLAFGCATTQGSSWVSQPEPGPFEGDALAVNAEPLVETHRSSFVSEFTANDVERPRPRLDHTVTLGEIVATDSGRGETSPATGTAPVSVTVNNYVQATPSYDGYYAVPVYTRGDGVARPTPHATPAPSHPGQNWPALPSYGPSFPFKTAPASPWR